MTKAQDQRSHSMKEQAYNMLKTNTKTQEFNDKAISLTPRKQDSKTCFRGDEVEELLEEEMLEVSLVDGAFEGALGVLGRKFNFSKYIFDSLVMNVDSSTKFYKYPRFLQLIIKAQVGDLSSHSTKYSSPALTQKVFANMRRVGKGFSGVDTPLFEGMIVAQQDDDIADEGAANVIVDDVPAAANEPTIPSPTPTNQPPPPSQDLPSTSQDKIAQSLEITKLKQWVKKLERKNKLKVSKLRRLKRVGTSQRVDTYDDTVIDDVSKQWRIIASMDADEDVTLKDVADIAKEVAVDTEIEENADAQGRKAKSQAQIYQIDLEHADKVLSMHDDEVKPVELQEDDVIDQEQIKEKEDNAVMIWTTLKE
nr:hypothetical protein [Tanacetum cinerariifolium]